MRRRFAFNDPTRFRVRSRSAARKTAGYANLHPRGRSLCSDHFQLNTQRAPVNAINQFAELKDTLIKHMRLATLKYGFRCGY